MKKLGFGFMRLPLLDTNDPSSIDQTQVNKMVDYFISQGFCYFDTAYPYHQGQSENAIKKAVVERYPRDSFVLADKMPVWLIASHEEYGKYFQEQMERCGVDYFDYYLLHTMGAKNYASTLQYDAFSFLKKIKEEGKAKHIGMSFHDKAEVLETILKEHPELEFVQLQINYIDWENETIEARKCYEIAVKYNKPVIVMEPVKGGSLAKVPEKAETLLKACHPDKSIASWAVRYAASLENVFMVLSGMSTFEQLQDNTGFMKEFQPLNKEEQEALQKATEIIAGSIAIPCTACQYCVTECPKNIPIPSFFSLYNNQKQFEFRPMHRNHYTNLIHQYGKASDCIACKRCEAHCPQHIAISEKMKEIAKVFENQ